MFGDGFSLSIEGLKWYPKASRMGRVTHPVVRSGMEVKEGREIEKE
jgi:hypothetical protein